MIIDNPTRPHYVVVEPDLKIHSRWPSYPAADAAATAQDALGSETEGRIHKVYGLKELERLGLDPDRKSDWVPSSGPFLDTVHSVLAPALDAAYPKGEPLWGASGHDIGWAMQQLKEGQRVTRPEMQKKGWNLKIGEGGAPNVIFCGSDSLEEAYQWQPTHADLLADDWQLDTPDWSQI